MERVLRVKKWRRGNALLLVAMAFVIAAPAPGQAGATANGQKVFHEKCEKCHGPDGSGNTSFGKALKASDLRSADVQKKADAEFYTQIEKGKKGMPPFGAVLDKTQIDAVIVYVREFGTKQSEAKK